MITIEEILIQLRSGAIDIAAALALACPERAGLNAAENGADLIVARLDHDRQTRCGFAEFVYGAGKTVEQLLAIVTELRGCGSTVLVTRLGETAGRTLLETFPEAEFTSQSGCFLWRDAGRPKRGNVVILAAGTSDLKVALEAEATLSACDCHAEVIVDVGIAGLHRLLKVLDRLAGADAIIAVAGMEGALPSVVAGLVAAPVIAVPTSVGYGAGLGGMTPLLAMLNSCANGVSVVNIDNGFGAACAAARIVNRRGDPASGDKKA